MEHSCEMGEFVFVRIRSFILPAFSRIRTEHVDLKSKSPYSVRVQENTDQKKLRIWKFFTQCWSLKFTLVLIQQSNLTLSFA